MRLHRLSLLLTALVLLSAGLSRLRSAAAATPTLNSVTVQAGLVNPWDVAFTPNGRMLVTERAGTLKIFANGNPGAALLAAIPIASVRAEGEAGLMGIAVDAKFRVNRQIYLCASRTDPATGQWLNQVLTYRLTVNNRLFFLNSVIGSGMQANTIHNGCAVEFGPDGKLWVSMGDAANQSLAQDATSLNGKILRVNPDGSVPRDNPVLPGSSGPSFVYSMGHRNPQGIAFQPGTNRVYAIEHGPSRDDEINWIRPGQNYGWPCYTGAGNPYRPNHDFCQSASAYQNPVWASGTPTLATSNGAFPSGADWGDWQGHFFVATLKEQDLRRLVPNSDGTIFSPTEPLFNGIWGRLRAVVRGPGNSLYLTTANGSNDQVIRLTATQP